MAADTEDDFEMGVSQRLSAFRDDRGQLNGTVERDWQPDGVVIRLSLDLQRLRA
jgi:hypothetical protein